MDYYNKSEAEEITMRRAAAAASPAPPEDEDVLPLPLPLPNKMIKEKEGLRVLLVDSDDSTRRLISALLRKCSYKVVPVSDGLKAWETLKARPQNIDLILTEVDLPSISGYPLLTLIMEHDICKRIPVIMMSSQDSITLVLRCMLRGAADFLVKPIRRNELMNMWQHVWRRQTKTEGCAVQNTMGAIQKVDAYCENKAGNDLSSSNVNDEDRRQERSLQPIGKSVLPTSEIGAKPSRSGPEVISREETNKSTVSSLGEDTTCARSLTSDASECPLSDLEHDNISGDTYRCTHELVEPSGAIDYIGKFEDYSGNVNGFSSAECGVDKLSYAPYLELSLRRPCPNGVEDEGTIEEQRLNHSNASAFSWYDNRKTMQSLSPAMGSNCGHGDVLSGSREDQVTRVVSQSGQAKAAVPGSQLGFIPPAVLSSDTIWHNYIPPELNAQSGLSPVFSPSSDVLCDQPCLPLNRPGSEDQDDRPTNSEQTVEENDNIGAPANGVRDASAVLEPSATSSSCSGSVGKLKSSICGSLGSTVDSSSGPFETLTKSSVSEGLKYSRSLFLEGLTGMDSHSPSQREAALQKFRLKRKDRCFDKKVRYQSRKRLAEQRPRVKGQFVREVKAEP